MSETATPAPLRLAIDPDRVEQDLTRLVLTLVEFLRRLMEAQAVRRQDVHCMIPDRGREHLPGPAQIPAVVAHRELPWARLGPAGVRHPAMKAAAWSP